MHADPQVQANSYLQRADYGDLETYLRDGLGVGAAERASLEARYLQV